MKVTIINGPNLNFLGKREETYYGYEPFELIFEGLEKDFTDLELKYKQSNIEGEIVTFIQESSETQDCILINAGGYSHYSIAILDALLSVHIPKVEIHMSNIHQRESFRQNSLITRGCDGVISGFGKNSYRLGLLYCRLITKSRIGFKNT